LEQSPEGVAAGQTKDGTDIDVIQKEVSEKEEQKWEKVEDRGQNGKWRREDRIIAPEIIQQTLLGAYHGLAHRQGPQVQW